MIVVDACLNYLEGRHNQITDSHLPTPNLSHDTSRDLSRYSGESIL
jgi:hypothetical protein